MSFRITPLNRPVEPALSLADDRTPAERAAEAAWIADRTALRAQFKREWVPPPGYSPEVEEEEMLNLDAAAFDVWLERRKGRTVAHSTPVWIDALVTWLVDGPEFTNNGLLALQPTAASLILPFRLKGGGELSVA